MDVQAASRASSPVSSSAPRDIAAAAQLYLLVVDDDPVHRMVIGKVGEKAGYAVATASSVDEAAEKMAGRQFDCISLDLSLGGPQVLNNIARSNGDVLLLVVNRSAAQMREETIESARDLRLKVVELPKPVDLASLRSKLTDHAALPRA
jgi:two-component system, chemotaxis family, chemotaxis protein CheY